MVSGGADGKIRIWDLDPIRMLAEASSKAGRNLSADEWRLYFGDKPFRRTFPEWPVGDGVEKAVKEGRMRLLEEVSP